MSRIVVTLRLQVACIGTAVASVMPLPAAAQITAVQATPQEILQQVARDPVPEVRFTEVRTTRLLKAPLTSSGVLRYLKPDRLERETVLPAAELVVIEGSQVSIERDGRSTVLALSAGSPAALLIQTLRAVLSGDWRELKSLHDVSADGSNEQWTLRMRPKLERTAVVEIRVEGRGARADRIEVLERSGDKTVTALTR